MSDWEEFRAGDIIWLQMGKRSDAASVIKLRAAIAQALREARAEGMMEAAALIDDMKASNLWVNAIRIKAAQSRQKCAAWEGKP